MRGNNFLFIRLYRLRSFINGSASKITEAVQMSSEKVEVISEHFPLSYKELSPLHSCGVLGYSGQERGQSRQPACMWSLLSSPLVGHMSLSKQD